MNNELYERLKELKIEDLVWIIYIGIIGLSLYSNTLERNYLLYKNKLSKEQYRLINIIIFGIVFIIYLYFVLLTYKDYQNSKIKGNLDKIKYNYLSFIATVFLFISGFIFLYVAINDKDIESEIGFL